MKIFYAIQATGNGHISRAMELLPYLTKYGKVDIFLSGSNSTLTPKLPVVFRSRGMSLQYTKHGSINLLKTLESVMSTRVLSEARMLPVENYDIIINDFEPVTSLACQRKNIPFIHFGHNACFISNKTPRPEKKQIIGEWVLKNYAKSNYNVGLHFEPYDIFIEPPVIKEEIQRASLTDHHHITVYLPSYGDKELINIFSKIKGIRFEIFSRSLKAIFEQGNLKTLPVDKKLFNASMISCSGIICGAGFETPAEALYLQKKLMVIPIKGQYEQKCNAAALKRMGVKTLKKIDKTFYKEFNDWLLISRLCHNIKFKKTQDIVELVMSKAPRNLRKK